MPVKKAKQKYVAFLRGINVGGHHKVPMAELRKEMEQLGYENVVTILNSGNLLFDGGGGRLDKLEKEIAEHLQQVFGFPVPTILRKAETIEALLSGDPFKGIELTKDKRFYVSFLRKDKEVDIQFPWTSTDHSFTITAKKNKTIISVLDLSKAKTPKAMEILEKLFQKENITTRNWKTLLRIEKKLDPTY